jgi:hypothetical protein
MAKNIKLDEETISPTGYNPDPELCEETKSLKPDVQAKGVITEVKDGLFGAFLNESAKEAMEKKGADLSKSCIEVHVKVTYENKDYNIRKLFKYESIKGKTVFSEKSDLGLFKKKYSTLPKVGVDVLCQTDADGFFQILPFLKR